jgi:DNA-binding GntR family transcriptional regulator
MSTEESQRNAASKGAKREAGMKAPRTPAPAAKTVGTREVVDWLQDRIRRGLLTPGQRLIEADISRQTGAARGHVREALRKLEAESIVVIEEFRGASVKRYSRDDIRRIYELRMALEGLAAGNFAGADLPGAKEQLAALQRELNRYERDINHEMFARTNDAWHSLIIESSGNAYLKQFVARLKIPIYRLLHRSFFNQARLDISNDAHKKITAAILAGKSKEAERLMRAHVADGLKMLDGMPSDYFD